MSTCPAWSARTSIRELLDFDTSDWRKKKALFGPQAIESHIGHMKSDGKFDRNYVKGHFGDKMNALLTVKV